VIHEKRKGRKMDTAGGKGENQQSGRKRKKGGASSSTAAGVNALFQIIRNQPRVAPNRSRQNKLTEFEVPFFAITFLG
jgi:hypothetical protein